MKKAAKTMGAGYGMDMKTINEDEDLYNYGEGQTKGGHSMLSKNYSNDQDIHQRSGNILEESIADPSRPPQHVEGVTDFLTEEYYKKFGIYTADATELQKFWKNHVSATYKEMRAQKAMLKNQTSFPIDGTGFNDLSGLGDFGGYSDLGMPGKGQNTQKYSKGKAGGLLGSAVKPPKPVLPKDNFLKKYEKYSKALELDVFMTVQKDINETEDKKRQESLKATDEAKKKQIRDQRNRQLKKMSDILDAYYQQKIDKEVNKEVQKINAEKYKGKSAEEILKMKEADKKSKIAKRSASARHVRPMSGKDTTPTKTMTQDDAKLVKPLDKGEQEAADKGISEDVFRGIQKKWKTERRSIEAVMTLVLDTKMTNDS